MGEVANDVLDGIMCQVCGVWMPDMFSSDGTPDDDKWDNPPGHPRSCDDCTRETIKRMKHI